MGLRDLTSDRSEVFFACETERSFQLFCLCNPVGPPVSRAWLDPVSVPLAFTQDTGSHNLYMKKILRAILLEKPPSI